MPAGTGSATDYRMLHEKLRQTADELAWLVKSDTRCCGISQAQVPVLIHIGKNAATTLSALGEAFSADTSTLSRTVDNLVTAGFVVRKSTRDDRRSVSLSLSAAGKKLISMIEENSFAYLESVLSCIPKIKREQVAESLALFADALTSCRQSGCCGFDFFRKEK